MSEIFGRTFCSTCKAMTVHEETAAGYECIHQRRHKDKAVLDSEIRFAEALNGKLTDMLDRSYTDRDVAWVQGNMSAVSELAHWILGYQIARSRERIEEIKRAY